MTPRGQGQVSQGPSRQRYFNNAAVVGTPSARPNRNQTRRLRLRNKLNGMAGITPLMRTQNLIPLSAVRSNKKAVLKLAKKRVQRAKLVVSKKRAGNLRANKIVSEFGYKESIS